MVTVVMPVGVAALFVFHFMFATFLLHFIVTMVVGVGGRMGAVLLRPLIGVYDATRKRNEET